MDKIFSPIENYPFLTPFFFRDNHKEYKKHKKALKKLLDEGTNSLKIKKKQHQEYLKAREKIFAKVISVYYEDNYKIIVENGISDENSFDTLSKNTYLLDSIINITFEYAFLDLKHLKEKFLTDLKKNIEPKIDHL